MKVKEISFVKHQAILKALKDLQECADIELAHGKADDLLCELLTELGLSPVVEEYKKIKKWYA